MATAINSISANELLDNVATANLALANNARELADTPQAKLIIEKQQFFARNLARLETLDFSQPELKGRQLELATNILTTISGRDQDLAKLVQNSLANASLSPEQAQTLLRLDSEVERANALASIPLGSSGEPLVSEFSTTFSALQDSVSNTLAIVFTLPPAKNTLQGFTLAGALLVVVNGMSSAISAAVNNYQTQINQMNAAQQLVQDTVNVVLQLSAQLKNAFNSFVQLAVSAAATPPSDLNITSTTKSAADYAAPTGANFWPSGVVPESGSKIVTPSAVWGDVNMASSIGQYCLAQAGVPFAGLVDSSYLVTPQGKPLTISAAIDTLPESIDLPQYSSSNLENQVSGSPPVATYPMSGENVCFLATGPNGPSISNSLAFSHDLFKFIDSEYLNTNIITTDASAQAPYYTWQRLQENPGQQEVGYLSMKTISAICQKALTQAGVFLPTKAYEAQYLSGLGPDKASPNGAETSVNILGGVSGSLAQVPSNLNTTITNTEQQAEALVASVTQLYQVLNQLITGSGTSGAFG